MLLRLVEQIVQHSKLVALRIMFTVKPSSGQGDSPIRGVFNSKTHYRFCSRWLPKAVFHSDQPQQKQQQQNVISLNEFRRGVGLCLFNRNENGSVFAARRMDDTKQTWQMPQGGIDPMENPLVAAVRELREETGIHPDSVRVVASIDAWLDYEFPTKVKNGNGHISLYRGQTQKWLLLEFLGSDDEIDLFSEHGAPEFSEWCWMPLEHLPKSVVDFKKGVYEEVCQQFAPRIRLVVDNNVQSLGF